MLFNSFTFLLLFPILLVANYSLSRFSQVVCNRFLLVVSLALYSLWSPAFLIVLLWVSIISYISAIIVTRISKNKKACFVVSLILILLPLLFYKYFNFFCSNIERLFSIAHITIDIPTNSWAVPVGLSFFTFQAISYFVDVYKRKFDVERNFHDYLLYICFFPQIASGPISRASFLMPQIKKQRMFNSNRAMRGLDLLLWGYFLKLAIADRIGLYVDVVFTTYNSYSGASCLIACLLYSIQIYSDFCGYSLMAIGIAKLLGFDLPDNFNLPYFSQSVTDFWKRWHISLTNWLKDYIYIPLGGNRCSAFRCYLNILITFLVSGLWHGANWTFIIWGAIHGVFQTIEKKLGYSRLESHGLVRVLRIIITFLLVTFAWIFFRSPDLTSACNIIWQIVTWQSGYVFIPNNTNIALMAVSLFVLFCKELCDFFNIKVKQVVVNNLYLRTLYWTFLICFILLFGSLDAGQFIYVNF